MHATTHTHAHTHLQTDKHWEVIIFLSLGVRGVVYSVSYGPHYLKPYNLATW